jgi:hypothetical protein
LGLLSAVVAEKVKAETVMAAAADRPSAALAPAVHQLVGHHLFSFPTR